MMAMTSVITVLTEAESSLLTGSYSGGVAAATGKMGFICNFRDLLTDVKNPLLA
jgi:hypothetical protein